MSILKSTPVTIGGAETDIPMCSDRHRDIGKPPTIGSSISSLLVEEDRDGQLAESRNSDSAHAFKFTATAGFAGGYAATIQFGYQYETDGGWGIAPMVFLDSSCPPGSGVQNVTSASYELHLPALAIGSVWRCSMMVQERTSRAKS